MRLALVILAVRDRDLAAEFYREALGWKLSVDVRVYAELEGPGGERLGIYQREAFAKNTGELPQEIEPGDLAPTELYFYVDDLAAACERVLASGGRPLSPRKKRPWGEEVAYFADPDGNVLALAKRHDDED